MSNYAGFALEPPITSPLWPSAAPALVTELLPLTSLDPRQGINKSFISTSDPQFTGFSDADVTNRSPGASGPMALRYGGLESIFVCALGLEARRIGATVMPQELSPGVWRHLFEVDPVLSAMAPWNLASDGIQSGDIAAGQRKVRRGTLAAMRGVSVWELLSGMVSQLSLAWQPDGCTCSLDTVGYSLTPVGTVNTPATMRRAVPNVAPDVSFWDLVVRLAPWSAVTPLSSVHELAVSSASLTLQNPFIEEQSPRTGVFIEEPERSGPAVIQGSLLEPRYVSNTLVNAWPANTRYMLDLKCTGPVLRPGYNWQLNCYIPGLFFTQVEPSPLSVGTSSLPLQWFAATPPSAASGMPSTARLGPLIVECVTDRATHTLLVV